MNRERLRQLRFKATKVALFCGIMSIVASSNASLVSSCSEALCGIISGTKSFGSGNSDSLSYRVSQEFGGSILYSTTFSGTAGSLTNLEIPLFNATDAYSSKGPSGWSSTILIPRQSGWNWSYAGGTNLNGKTIFNASSNVINAVVSFSGPPVLLSSDPTFDFTSNFAPVMAPYQLVIGGGTAFVDPPIPGHPVPEPASLLLTGVGLLGLVAAFKRK